MDIARRQQLQRRIKRELRSWGIAALLLVTVLAIGGSVLIDYLEHHLHNPQESSDGAPPAPRPRPVANVLRNAYFGDLHAHSALSLQANVRREGDSPAGSSATARARPTSLPRVSRWPWWV